MDTAATPPCFGYYTRLLLQAVADSRLTLHPAAHFRLEQTKPRDLHQPAFRSTTIRTPPLLHSSTSLPLPLSGTPESHTMHHNQCLQSDPYKTRDISTAILLICQDTSTSLFSLHHPRTATKQNIHPYQIAFTLMHSEPFP